MLFSKRHGYEEAIKAIQHESIDSDLRTGIWNILKINIWDKFPKTAIGDYGEFNLTLNYYNRLQVFITLLWRDYYKKDLDSIPEYWTDVYEVIKENYMSCPWYSVYNFIEFIINTSFLSGNNLMELIKDINLLLEKENSAYRIVNKQIVPITDDLEIESISEALQNDDKIKPVSNHLADALTKIADKENPDYRNSIKESISAVESMCNIVAGKKTTLSKALRKLKSDIQIHPSLEQGFQSIYGYTSDEHGIRHSMMDEPNVKFEDAKYMLVSCSAFINYLKQKADEAGLI